MMYLDRSVEGKNKQVIDCDDVLLQFNQMGELLS